MPGIERGNPGIESYKLFRILTEARGRGGESPGSREIADIARDRKGKPLSTKDKSEKTAEGSPLIGTDTDQKMTRKVRIIAGEPHERAHLISLR